MPNRDLIARSVDELIRERLNDARQGSIIQPPEDAGLDSDPLLPSQNGQAGGGWVTVSRIGYGKGDPKIPFSKFVGGFNPSDLHLSSLVAVDPVGTPNRPRQFTATPVATSGAPNERVDMRLNWYPPLTDTTGRWLVAVSLDTANNVQFRDVVESYLITRKDLGTGEEAVVAVVSHSDQFISAMRAYLEAEHAAGRAGATTDAVTLIATLSPDFTVEIKDPTTQEVLYTEPYVAGHEQSFTFTDSTAVNGHNYIYYIQALTGSQVESLAATAIPGAVQFASGLDVTPSPSWSSSYPNLTGAASGTEAFLDVAFSCGNLVSSVEVSLIPIMDSALTINTTPQPDTDPFILRTDPDPTKLQRPLAGTNVQKLTFIGRNLELWGGITAIDLGAGITFTNPGANLTKTRVGTSDDWVYTANLTVSAAVELGIKTMYVTLGSGGQAQHSTIEVIPEVAATEGPTLDDAGKVLYLNNLDPVFILTGKNLDKIQTLVPSSGTITINSKSPTQLTATYLGSYGMRVVTCTLVEGCTSTGKDTFKLYVTHDSGRDKPISIPQVSQA